MEGLRESVAGMEREEEDVVVCVVDGRGVGAKGRAG